MATIPITQAPWGEYVARVGRMTVEQFAGFPTDDSWTYELHHGRLISMPGPGALHGDIHSRVFELVNSFLRAHGLGLLRNTSCYNLPLPDTTEEVLCPDLSYVELARKAAMPLRGSYPVGAPDLVIEIASPGDTHPELAAKASVYLQAGVRLIWIVWPGTRTVEVWRPGAGSQPTATLGASETLDGADVLPGFACPVRDLFTV